MRSGENPEEGDYLAGHRRPGHLQPAGTGFWSSSATTATPALRTSTSPRAERSASTRATTGKPSERPPKSSD